MTVEPVREPPFLIADASSWQGEDPPWHIIAEHCVGLILKATQGLHYSPEWFVRHWNKARDVAADRYGSTWLRGAYHYLDFNVPGARQADVYSAHVEKAGGWDTGDICPIVDVERGGANHEALADRVVDCVSAFTRRVKEVLSRDVILYGRGAMRDLAIRSRMGCAAVWNPGYTTTMPMSGLAPTWSVEDVALWQYTDGTSGDARTHHLPLRLPGWTGGLDLSVFVDGSNKPTLERLRERLLRR